MSALDGSPASLVLGREACVALSFRSRELTLQLAVALQPLGFEPSVGDRGVYGAAGLGAVLTVREAALPGERGDVLEHIVHLLAALEEL